MRMRCLPLGLLLSLILASAGWGQPRDEGRGEYLAQLDHLLESRFEANRAERDRALNSMTTRQQVLARQQRVRERFVAELGGLPTTKSPLKAQVTGTVDREGYTIEKVIFESLPGFKVTANLYLPKSGKKPFPAVLGTAGHSANGKAGGTYQAVWVSLARRGWAVLAFDPPGQGERFEYLDPATRKSRVGAGVPEHNMTGMQCLLTGQNIARYFVWDGIRAFDYMLTRKEIDPKRIVVAGNSGGGTQSAYLGVADQRLAGVISSCYPTAWRNLWTVPGPQDAEQVTVPWIAEGFDFSDFVLAAAPKPYLLSSALRDFFPIAGARVTLQEAKRFYQILGDEERVHQITADEQHGWSKPLREQAYAWLGQWFGVPGMATPEEKVVLESDGTLAATPTGQLQNSIGSRTVRDFNREHAVALRKQREERQRTTPLSVAEIRRTLGMRELRGVPTANSKGTSAEEGVTIEKLELQIEPGLKIPALLFVPAGGGKKPGVLFASSAGKDNRTTGTSALSLARSGSVVLAVDPRGMGEAGPAPKKGGYSPLYQLAARTWLLNESLAGMQVNDLLASLRYLRARPEVIATEIRLVGQGNAGPLAIFAAAIDGKTSGVVTESSIHSYEDLVNAEIYRNMENLIVPGILQHLDLPEVVKLIGANKVQERDPADFAR